MRIFAVDNDAKGLSQMSDCLGQVFPEAEVIPFTDPMLAVKSMYNCPNEIQYVFTALLRKFLKQQAMNFYLIYIRLRLRRAIEF